MPGVTPGTTYLQNTDPRRSKLVSGTINPSLDNIWSVFHYQGAGNNYKGGIDRRKFGLAYIGDSLAEQKVQELHIQNYLRSYAALFDEMRITKIELIPVLTCDTFNTTPVIATAGAVDVGTVPTKPLFCHYVDRDDNTPPNDWNVVTQHVKRVWKDLGKVAPKKAMAPFCTIATLKSAVSNESTPGVQRGSNFCVTKNLSRNWLNTRNIETGVILGAFTDVQMPNYKWMIYNLPPFSRIAFRIRYHTQWRKLHASLQVPVGEGDTCVDTYQHVFFSSDPNSNIIDENTFEECPSGDTGGTGMFMDEESSLFLHDDAGLRIEPIPGPVGWDKPLLPPCGCGKLRALCQ